jgi:nucleotide-binding universal stress UspA family protein
MLPIKKILCPTDFSEPSLEALKTAGDLAAQFDSELYVLHVMEPLEPVLGIISKDEFDDSRMRDAAQCIYQQVRDVVAEKVRIGPIIRSGDAATEILQIAAKEQPDLIVIATNGKTGWRHLIFGSVAEAVVRQAEQSVLTVHKPCPED